MAKRAVTTRVAGKVSTGRTGVRKSFRPTVKEEPTETPRELFLKNLGLDPAKFANYDTLDLLDLQYSLTDPILEERYRTSLEKLQARKEMVPKIFPYDSLLKDRNEEYKFQVNYKAEPIEAGDCGRCGQKGTVTFIAFSYHRADEAGTSLSRCTACGAKY
jgi:DNA-directed RNA polymerase subunit M/transcription elongation factor TFIIS